jgi:hypothetical protein
MPPYGMSTHGARLIGMVISTLLVNWVKLRPVLGRMLAERHGEGDRTIRYFRVDETPVLRYLLLYKGDFPKVGIKFASSSHTRLKSLPVKVW